MFVWLFPAEELWGARALIIVPAVLGAFLALVPILDRSPYMNPRRRKAVVGVAAVIILIIVVSGVVATLQPVAAHLG